MYGEHVDVGARPPRELHRRGGLLAGGSFLRSLEGDTARHTGFSVEHSRQLAHNRKDWRNWTDCVN